MASIFPLQSCIHANILSHSCSSTSARSFSVRIITTPTGLKTSLLQRKSVNQVQQGKRSSLTVVAAVGDVSAEGTNYLIAGAVAVALLGTAFPILFSRKDLCPECDGAGFVRKSTGALRANAARKDQVQIVCARCNGLGKLNQIDK